MSWLILNATHLAVIVSDSRSRKPGYPYVWLVITATLMLLILRGDVRAQHDGYWFTRAPLPTAREEVMPGLADGQIYVIGGYLPSLAITNLVEIFNPATNSWSGATPYPLAVHHYSIATHNGLLYVISGYTTAALPWSVSSSVHVYDPTSDTWAARASVPTPRGEAVAAEFGGKIYLFGGNDANGDDLTSVEVYDPVLDTWSSVTPMPTARHHPGVAVIDSLIYLVGGRTGYWGQGLTVTGVVEAYSPASDTWYSRAALPTPRSALSVAAYDGRLYAFGGEWPTIYAEAEEYDPATDTWRSLTPMLTPRHGTGAIVIADTIFVIGGGAMVGADDVSDANEGFVLGTCDDIDYDGFGHPSHPENTCPPDNCVWPYNPEQLDSDGDGFGDPCDGCPDDPNKTTPGTCGCGVSDTDSDDDTIADCNDVCPGWDDLADGDQDGVPDGCDNCPEDYNPDQSDQNQNDVGDVCDGCCEGRVGDANGLGGDEPTIGDVSTMINALFIGGDPVVIACLAEADINQSGDTNPQPSDITIGDISVLIDYLFITGSSLGLGNCLSDQQPLEIPYGSAVNIDGVMEEGEWDDASVALSSVPGAVEATIYAKHDGANLLVAFRYSFAGDEEVWVPEVLLDIDYDQASDWQDDDWWIHVSAQDCAISGAYDIWTVCAIVEPDWEAVPNFATFPYTVPLDFFEIRLPLSKMNLSVGSMIGVAFRLRHGTVATEGYWPPTAVIANPSTWGTAILKTQNPASSLKGAHRK